MSDARVVVSVEDAVRVNETVRILTYDEKEYIFVPQEVLPSTNRKGNLVLKAEGELYIKENGKIISMMTGTLYIGDDNSEENNITLEIK